MPMAELTFSQSERRSYLGPVLSALTVLIAAATGAWLYFPHHAADLTITHTAETALAQVIFES